MTQHIDYSTNSGGSTTLGVEASVAPATLRFLGAAFLVQAIGSAVSGLMLAPVDLLANAAPDDMSATMADIAENEGMLRASIVGEMVTAAGIVALGILLFTVLRQHARHFAGIALGLYLVEAALLATREVLVYALGSTSEQAAAGGATNHLVDQGAMLFEAQSFAYSLHTLVFAAGATIFYILFAFSGLLPRVLLGLGLIAAPLALIGQLLVVLGSC